MLEDFFSAAEVFRQGLEQSPANVQLQQCFALAMRRGKLAAKRSVAMAQGKLLRVPDRTLMVQELFKGFNN